MQRIIIVDQHMAMTVKFVHLNVTSLRCTSLPPVWKGLLMIDAVWCKKAWRILFH